MAINTWNLEEVQQWALLYQLAEHRCSKCIHWDWEKGCHVPGAEHNLPVRNCYCFEPVAATPSYGGLVKETGV